MFLPVSAKSLSDTVDKHHSCAIRQKVVLFTQDFVVISVQKNAFNTFCSVSCLTVKHFQKSCPHCHLFLPKSLQATSAVIFEKCHHLAIF